MEAPSVTIPEAVAPIEAGALVIDVRDGPKAHLPTLGPRAVHVLKQAGFAHAVNLAPGIEGWRAANLPVVSS